MAPAACPTTTARPWRAIVAALAVALLAACEAPGTQPLTREQVDKLEANMTRKEVEILLGEPAQHSDQSWVYKPKTGPIQRLDISFEPDRGGSMTDDYRVTTWRVIDRHGS